jgi:hypothetical protein
MKRMFVALIIPILLISVSALGISHFTQTVQVRYGLHVACVDVGFATYKYKSPWASLEVDTPDRYVLDVSTEVFPGWYCWMGFILQNFGLVFPANVSSPAYKITLATPTDDIPIDGSFVHNEYFYGPWTRNDVPQNVYAKVWVPSSNHLGDSPPPSAVLPPPLGNVPPPVYLEPSGSGGGSRNLNSMVLWIFLQYPKTAPPLAYPVQIVITITASFG